MMVMIIWMLKGKSLIGLILGQGLSIFLGVILSTEKRPRCHYQGIQAIGVFGMSTWAGDLCIHDQCVFSISNIRNYRVSLVRDADQGFQEFFVAYSNLIVVYGKIGM
jgi:hypothetical protein